MTNRYNIFLLLAVTIPRIIAVYFFADQRVDMEWGDIVSNLENYKIFGARTVDGIVVPNIFMPPLYPIFLYCIKIFFNNIQIYLIFIYFLQIIFSLVSTYFIYKTLIEFYSKKTSYIGCLIFALYPLNIYSVGQISSICIQILFLSLFLYYVVQNLKFTSFKNILLLSFYSGLLILLRGEFFIFYFLTVLFIFLRKKNLKFIVLSILITILTISPYLKRNFDIFGVLTVTKSGGYNLLKGNNPLAPVEGYPLRGREYNISKNLGDKIKNLRPSNQYDLIIDDYYKEEAVKIIKKNPIKYLKLYFKKALSFIFIDLNSSYPNYYNLLNIIPKMIISITTLMSICFLLFKNKDLKNTINYFTLYYFCNIGLFSVFFILPRYNLSLLPIQIILSLYLLRNLK
jgi:hypothetical protein